MPTYEFRCPDGHDFEKFYRSISGAPRELPCLVCGKVAERQLSAGGGLVFKGSGFYITDYGKDGKKPQTSGTGGSDKTGGESSTSKPDASPPAKSEAKSAESKPTPGGKASKGSKASE
jgi:putative FmdB family regulatory protein